jgi:DNA-directed RNA polymerase specialized sigma24 family protein
MVAQAVAALPPLQREALILAEYEEMSLEQMVQLTGADLAAVKSRLHRARENLRRMLAPLMPPRGTAYGKR